jgi:hypothetical protein
MWGSSTGAKSPGVRHVHQCLETGPGVVLLDSLPQLRAIGDLDDESAAGVDERSEDEELERRKTVQRVLAHGNGDRSNSNFPSGSVMPQEPPSAEQGETVIRRGCRRRRRTPTHGDVRKR